MEPKAFLEDINFKDFLNQIHTELTLKKCLDDTCFDSWYTENASFFHSLTCKNIEFASKIGDRLKINWSKNIPSNIQEVLKKHNKNPKNWEDYPEGQLSALAILLSGWTINQLSSKARDNPNGTEGTLG